ncbi:MAG: MFS transporter [Egibacteraceae bacterium]
MPSRARPRILDPDHRWYPRVLVAAVATVVTVAYGVILYGFSVLVTEQAAGGVFSATVLSGAFGGAVLVGGAASVVIGRVADRHGVRAVMGLGSLLAGGGLVGFAAARQPWQVLAVWWLVLGPATAMTFYEPAFVVIEQWFDRGSRNKAVATLTFLAGLAGPIFIPVTSWLVGALGWRQATMVLGVLLAAVGGATALLVIRPAPSVLARREGADAQPVPLRGVLASRRFLWFTAGTCLALLAFEAIIVHRVARFEAAGFAVATVAFWAAASGVASFPARLALPRMADRFRGTRLFVLVLAGMVIAAALAIGGRSDVELVGHFTVFGLVFGAAIPLRAVIMSDWYAGVGFGRLMGVQAAAIALSRAAGPTLTGALRDATGSYGPPMAVLTGVLVAAVACVLVAERAADPLARHPPARHPPGSPEAAPPASPTTP